jgi:glycolate oxidase FAD binding subunit
MTILQPTSIAELAAAIPQRPRWSVRGGGTKPGLARAGDDHAVLDLSRLAGIVEHTPEECTFTARAGTPVVEIERALAPHGQYLPFDPPLAAAGATIGGTVAAGINGSCRYRFGGIRDFLIGVRLVDGEGRIVQSGGKVVKNAAGFLLHQAMVGSCGRLGVVAELTFKVFPAPAAHATVRVDAGDLESSLSLMAAVQRERFDLEAIDLTPPGVLTLRLGGAVEALGQRVAALKDAVGRGGQILVGEDEAAVWREARELSWVAAGGALVRVPLSLPQVRGLDAALATDDGCVRRYAVAGNLAWVSWRAPIEGLDGILRRHGLVGQVLAGAAGAAFIGACAPNPFEQRLRSVMDPSGRLADS